jgi:hypothetical protein
MNASSEDIRHMLEAGLTESDSSGEGLDLVFATNLFINSEPSKPINCVTIYDTSGFPPYLGLAGETGYEYPSVQVRIRNQDSQAGWVLAEGIKNSLHGRHGQVWNGTLYSSIACSSGPALLDKDDNGNFIFYVNFNLQRRVA